jgi:uncharacterized protein (TIGR02117 family)
VKKQVNLKRIRKRILQFLLGFAMLLVLYFAAVFLMPRITFSGDSGDKAVLCYLKSNGSHVDLVMPIETNSYKWLEKLNLEHIEYADSTFSWVAFGWGDKNFYLNTPTWGDLTFSTAFKAAFWLGTGAIHVTYYKELSSSEKCLPFYISEAQCAHLYNFILNDFVVDADQVPVYIDTDMNYGPRDCFYESNKKYSIFHTCNTWVNDALKAINTKHCYWTALEFGIMDLYCVLSENKAIE